MKPPRLAVSEFARRYGRRGDLGSRHFSLLRGVEGIRAHQRAQRERGPDYQAEVSIQTCWESATCQLELFGRMDGLDRRSPLPLIEEFKTSRDNAIDPADHGVHLLQIRLYGWMWWRNEGVYPRLRLVYLHPDSEVAARAMEIPFGAEDCAEIAELMQLAVEDLQAQQAWCARRDVSLRDLAFPFPGPRPGQEELMRESADCLRQGGRLLVQAPTGIGKTAAVLVAGLRALGRGDCELLFVASCRNAGRLVFHETLRLLTRRGCRLRVLTLLAKDRICQGAGSPCRTDLCPLAKGFYDRLPAALRELRSLDGWDDGDLRRISAGQSLCPYALQMALTGEADVILGDLNFALDPRARVETLFGEDGPRLGLLIDEAHHLPERARRMCGAVWNPAAARLRAGAFSRETAGPLMPALRALRRAVSDWGRHHLDAEGRPLSEAEVPRALGRACFRLLEALEVSLAAQPPTGPDPRLDLLRNCADVVWVVDNWSDAHIAYREQDRLCLFCRDPAYWLRKRFARLHAVIAFSGTLPPLRDFAKEIGWEEPVRTLTLRSPFPREHFRIEIESTLPVHWQARSPALYARLARRIQEFIGGKGVNTLVFFPSYAFLEAVAEFFPAQDLFLGAVHVQPRGLQEYAADQFLQPFRDGPRPQTGLAVLGGALNEGIDLPGDALQAVVVVSVGFPAVCPEREWIRDWVQRHGGDGFHAAYVAPGLLRVRQALGRVIRSEEDRGCALLIDPRFHRPEYAEIFDSDESPKS